jgi:hypothetical protein
VTNLSDKVYIYTNGRGQSVSVEVPAPTGVQLSPDIDISRFVVNGNSIFDTRPVQPATEHNFHLLYTVHFDGSFDFTQTFPYGFFGPFEAYGDSSQLKLRANNWEVLETPQNINGTEYHGIAKVDGFAANQEITFSIRRSGLVINRQVIGYGVIALGLVLIVIAGLFYRRTPPNETSNTVEALLKKIASLDNQYQNGSISERKYNTRRKTLKDKVTKLMKEQEA